MRSRRTDASDDEITRDYREHYPLLVRIAISKFGLTCDDAESVTQEVFVSYLVHLDCIRDRRRWLIGAVCNASRVHIRQRARTIYLSDVDVAANRAQAVRPTAPAAATAADLVNRLRPRTQVILTRKYIEGFTTRELASELATTEGYAEQLVHDALREARSLLG